MRKTKIVCTIGPTCESPAMLRALVEAGMNVARLNFSHGDHEEQGSRIRNLQALRAEMNIPLGIMLDTKGPEIRLGDFKNDGVELTTGQDFTLTTRDIMGDESIVSVSLKELPSDVNIGAQILVDDGLIELQVKDIQGEDILCSVLNGGPLRNRKGVNLPGTSLSMPSLSDKDRADIVFGSQMGIDYIAASFVRSAEDVLAIRSLLAAQETSDIHIIAKIENRRGVDNIEEILAVTDGIMVARGDLGVEIPIEEVPIVQKRLIHLCNLAGKPVITATQMLDSMMHNPRPTRAEANDVANSIIDGTDAVMLSGETASGKYPLEAVRTMERIANNAQSVPHPVLISANTSVTAAVSHACCNIANDLGAKAIVTPTKSGTTALMVGRHRPNSAIFGCAMNEACYHRMSLYWGIVPLMIPTYESTEELTSHALKIVEAAGYVTSGDTVVITAGVPLSIAGTTNLIHVQIVGDVLLRGSGIGARSAVGRARLTTGSPDCAVAFDTGDILVTHATDNSLLPLMKKAAALVVEDGDILGHAAVVGLALDIPVILAARGAMQRIFDGMLITVDAATGFVYNGKSDVH